ncbi:MAG: YdeI/OmpD-associated family protein [Candidatus Diapherotrites archaeon]|nr:YdeI/OmpD-associated family protein [Candidatus Diapherotrites archaeon]MDZ4256854.1 YdeI/OmpD-associated family protein [archaeon]
MPTPSNLFYAPDRDTWRKWLQKHHATAKEIYLVYYKKGSGKPRVSYKAAVEEALCFGWIDSTAKGIDDEQYAQRFSPRRKKSFWSEPNRERVRMLMKQKKMTPAGLAVFPHHEDTTSHAKKFKEKLVIPKDIEKALKKDPETWKHFQSFDKTYKRIRVGWIDAARKRPEIFAQRLNYFLKMTKKGKRYEMMEKK